MPPQRIAILNLNRLADMTRLHIGISTCPNDTYAFDGLIRGQVDARGIQFEFEYLDIEQLNRRWIAGDFDLAKTSFATAARQVDRTVVLPVGSALGFGVGPLLLSSIADAAPRDASQRCLCPGEMTTATALFGMFYAGTSRVEQVVFSDIMPALEAGHADFGVCIHEGRFVWESLGLHLVEDLGTRWESETHLPLPLGGLVARRDLGPALIASACDAIRGSIRAAHGDPDAALPTMRQHAQEFDDAVLLQHVELYVNDWTIDLGVEGRKALAEFAKRLGGDAGLEVFDDRVA